MNTIKFSNANEMRKETADVSTYSIKKIDINGKKYKYFSDTQICLYITKSCNADCDFCINKYNKKFSKCVNINEKSYLNKLEKYLDLFKDNKPYISITGGEPTKDKKLIPVLKLLKKKGFKIRTFATNGSGLLDIYDEKIILEYLKDIYINSINLSRAVIDDTQNNRLMKIKTGEITNDMIKKIGIYSKVNDMETRMSCILLKDGVNNLKKILEYKDFYNNIGISTVMFRELMPFDSKSYNDMKINIKDIFNEIEMDNEFKFIRAIEGMYYIVKIYRYKNEIVKCYTEKDIMPEEKEIIRDFFIFPDMKLLDGYNNKKLME